MDAPGTALEKKKRQPWAVFETSVEGVDIALGKLDADDNRGLPVVFRFVRLRNRSNVSRVPVGFKFMPYMI
jgi:hypothetical protein